MDYDLTLRGVSYYGYFSLCSDDINSANFASWLASDTSSDPLEGVFSCRGFNLSIFARYLRTLE